MVELVQKLTTIDAFDARGVLVPAGHVGAFDPDKITDKDTHLHDIGDMPPSVPVEIAAIAPTGPNPTQPQQLPADAVQGPGGTYVLPGKTLVGEVTNPAGQRIDDAGLRDADAENEVSARLADIMDTPAPTAAPAASGTVAEVTANLGGLTDQQLSDLAAAEKTGANRKGVLSAIEAEQADRAGKNA
jgi:hypothetical protein